MRKLFGILITIFSLNGFADTGYNELRITAGPAGGVSRILQADRNEVIPLQADIWRQGGACPTATGCYDRVAPAEFLWSSEDRPQATCDLYSASACAGETNFEVIPAGVNFRVPDTITSPITIVARQRGGGLLGSIVIEPRAREFTDYPPPPATPSVVVVHETHPVVAQSWFGTPTYPVVVFSRFHPTHWHNWRGAYGAPWHPVYVPRVQVTVGSPLHVFANRPRNGRPHWK